MYVYVYVYVNVNVRPQKNPHFQAKDLRVEDSLVWTEL